MSDSNKLSIKIGATNNASAELKALQASLKTIQENLDAVKKQALITGKELTSNAKAYVNVLNEEESRVKSLIASLKEASNASKKLASTEGLAAKTNAIKEMASATIALAEAQKIVRVGESYNSPTTYYYNKYAKTIPAAPLHTNRNQSLEKQMLDVIAAHKNSETGLPLAFINSYFPKESAERKKEAYLNLANKNLISLTSNNDPLSITKKDKENAIQVGDQSRTLARLDRFQQSDPFPELVTKTNSAADRLKNILEKAKAQQTQGSKAVSASANEAAKSEEKLAATAEQSAAKLEKQEKVAISKALALAKLTAQLITTKKAEDDFGNSVKESGAILSRDAANTIRLGMARTRSAANWNAPDGIFGSRENRFEGNYENRDNNLRYNNDYKLANYTERDLNLQAAKLKLEIAEAEKAANAAYNTARLEAFYANRQKDDEYNSARKLAVYEETDRKLKEKLANQSAAGIIANASPSKAGALAAARAEAEGKNIAEINIARINAETEARKRQEIATRAVATATKILQQAGATEAEITTVGARVATESLFQQARAAEAAASAQRVSSATFFAGKATNLLDEAARGQRGAMVSTLGSTLKAAGLGVAGLAASFGALIVLLGTDKILKSSEELGTWASKMRAGAAAAGMTIESYSRLNGALSIIGVKGESADASLRRLAVNINQAVANPFSKAAEAFHNMGISQKVLEENSKNAANVFGLLSERYVELSKNAENADNIAGNLSQIFGKGFQSVIIGMEQGSVRLKELENEADKLHLTLDEKTAKSLEKTGQSVRGLGEKIKGDGIKAMEGWAPIINNVAIAFDSVYDKIMLVVGGLGHFISTAVTANSVMEHTASLAERGRGAHAQDNVRSSIPSVVRKQTTNARGMRYAPDIPIAAATNNSAAQIASGSSEIVPPLEPPVGARELIESQASAAALAASAKAKDRQTALIEEEKARIAAMEKGLASEKLDATQRIQLQNEINVKKLELNNQLLSESATVSRQDYANFAAAERLKITEAEGNVTKIVAIYKDWAKQAADVYKQSGAAIIDINNKMTQTIISNNLRQLEESIKFRNEQRKLTDIMTEARKISAGTQPYAGELTVGGKSNIEEQIADLVTRAQENIKNTSNDIFIARSNMNAAPAGSEEQKKAAEEIINIEKESIQERIALYNKAAELSIQAAQKETQGITKFFDSVGSNFDSMSDEIIKALIAPQRELIKQGLTTEKKNLQGTEIKNALSKMLVSGIMDSAKGVQNALSQILAKTLSNALNISMQQGGGLGSLLSGGIGKLLGTGAGKLPGVDQFGLSATALTQAATVLNSASLTQQTAATSLTTAAISLQTAASYQGISSGGALMAFKAGGIIPSAAGGMVAGGIGGTLSLLHPKEMVLPEHLSTGIQKMIGNGFGGNGISNSANLNFSPTINTSSKSRGGTGMSRNEFAQMLSNHSGAMFGEARNMMRNGWRPA